MHALLLNQHQARHVRRAMLECSVVSARIHVRFDTNRGTLHVVEHTDKSIDIYMGDAVGNPCGPVEIHINQMAFAIIYGV